MLGMRPLIGVFTSERHAGALGTLQRCEGAPEPELRLGTPYLRAVEAAGGLPVVLGPDDPETAVALLDRLASPCLAGGPALAPLSSGDRERPPLRGNTNRRTDMAELALLRTADQRGLPVLGICRGAQAMNVARGGTLRQHVDDHRQTAPASQATHDVRVTVGSRLAALTGAGRGAGHPLPPPAAGPPGGRPRGGAAARGGAGG